MAVVSVIEISPLSANDSMRGGTEYRRRFLVTCDRPDENPSIVKAASGIPAIAEALTVGGVTDFSSVVVSRDARQMANRRLWEVEVKYSSESPNEDKTKNPEDESDPYVVRWSSINIEKARGYELEPDSDNAGKVKLGDAIKNSAGEIFDPPPVYNDAMPVLYMETTIPAAQFNHSIIRKFVNKLNKNPVTIGTETYAARTVKCSQIEATYELKRGAGFWRIGQELQFNFEVEIAEGAVPRMTSGWDEHLLDHGTYYLDGANKIKFTDADGNPIKGNLDGAGGKLADGLPPVFLTFKLAAEEDFTTLPIDPGIGA